MNPRFPSKVTFPFGYTVRVDLVTQEEMDERDGAGLDGLWDPRQRTISILRSCSQERRRYMLYHELTHALADAFHHLTNSELIRG